jgi:hypothetical protein
VSPANSEDKHYLHSTLRERIVEHVFVGELLRALWKEGILNVELLRPEFDAHGYDVVISRGAVVRHIQLKTQAGGKISVSQSLGEKPSGCVLWIAVDRETLQLGPFLWFGGSPGDPLPDVAQFPNPKRQTHNSQKTRPLRKNHRSLPRSVFVRLDNMRAVAEKLFGHSSLHNIVCKFSDLSPDGEKKNGSHDASVSWLNIRRATSATD